MNNNNEVKVQFEGHDVVYNTKTKTWEWFNIGETAVKAISPDKYVKIVALLEKEVTAYQEMVKQEEETRRQQELLKKRTIQTEFIINEVKPNIPNDFEALYSEIKDSWDSELQNFRVQKKGNSDITAYIKYSGTVHSGARWDMSGHNTDKPWEVSIDYDRRVRYSSIEKAIAASVKGINEKITIQETKKQAEQEKKDKNAQLTNALKEQGIEMKVETEWHRNYGSSNGYSVETRKVELKVSDKVGAVIGDVIEANGEILIQGVRITGLAFTPEKLKTLVSTLQTMFNQ